MNLEQSTDLLLLKKCLSAEELVALRKPADALVPLSTGEKGYIPNETWLEEKQVECLLQDQKAILKEKRAARMGELMQAEWDITLQKAVTSKLKGKFINHMGHSLNGKIMLCPEEAVFLVECGSLEVLYGGMPLSTEEAYSLMLSGKLAVEKYQVYSHLSRLGYIVVQHQEKLTITPYEKKMRLDQHVEKRKQKCNDTKKEQKNESYQKIASLNSCCKAISKEMNTEKSNNTEESVNVMIADSSECLKATKVREIADDVPGANVQHVSEESYIQLHNTNTYSFETNEKSNKMNIDSAFLNKTCLERNETSAYDSTDDIQCEIISEREVANKSSESEQKDENLSSDEMYKSKVIGENIEEVNIESTDSFRSNSETDDREVNGDGSNNEMDIEISEVITDSFDGSQSINYVNSEKNSTYDTLYMHTKSNNEKREDSSDSLNICTTGNEESTVDSTGMFPLAKENSEEMVDSHDSEIMNDPDIIFVEVKKKESKPLAVIDILSDDDNDTDDSVEKKPNISRKMSFSDDDDIQIIEISPECPAKRTKITSEKFFLPNNLRIKSGYSDSPPLMSTSSKRKDNFWQFPDLAGKTVICLARPPAHLLPPNVRLSKEAYPIDVRMLTKRPGFVPYRQRDSQKLWNSWSELKDKNFRSRFHRHSKYFSPDQDRNRYGEQRHSFEQPQISPYPCQRDSYGRDETYRSNSNVNSSFPQYNQEWPNSIMKSPDIRWSHQEVVNRWNAHNNSSSQHHINILEEDFRSSPSHSPRHFPVSEDSSHLRDQLKGQSLQDNTLFYSGSLASELRKMPLLTQPTRQGMQALDNSSLVTKYRGQFPEDNCDKNMSNSWFYMNYKNIPNSQVEKSFSNPDINIENRRLGMHYNEMPADFREAERERLHNVDQQQQEVSELKTDLFSAHNPLLKVDYFHCHRESFGNNPVMESTKSAPLSNPLHLSLQESSYKQLYASKETDIPEYSTYQGRKSPIPNHSRQVSSTKEIISREVETTKDSSFHSPSQQNKTSHSKSLSVHNTWNSRVQVMDKEEENELDKWTRRISRLINRETPSQSPVPQEARSVALKSSPNQNLWNAKQATDERQRTADDWIPMKRNLFEHQTEFRGNLTREHRLDSNSRFRSPQIAKSDLQHQLPELQHCNQTTNSPFSSNYYFPSENMRLSSGDSTYAVPRQGTEINQWSARARDVRDDSFLHHFDRQSETDHRHRGGRQSFHHHKRNSYMNQQNDRWCRRKHYGHNKEDLYPSAVPKLPENISSWKDYKSKLTRNEPNEEEMEKEDDVQEVQVRIDEVLWSRNIHPLMKPGAELPVADVLNSLKIIKTVNLVEEKTAQRCLPTRCSLEICFDVYLPDTVYRKSCPTIPNHRLIVLRATDPLPKLAEIVVLQRKFSDGAMLQFAVVDNGDIAFYSFNDITLPMLISEL